MSYKKLFSAAACVAVFSASQAFAQSPPPGYGSPYGQPPSRDQMTEMCQGLYQDQQEQLDYLQSKLSLTDAQHGAFDRWRAVMLDTAKSRSDACLAHLDMMGHPPDALARNDAEQQMLEARLQNLRNERPALEALYLSLTPDQKATFDNGNQSGGAPGGRPPQ
jgi:hypothetical protein